jgi:membrane-bound lytic murein transglycosylase D
MSTSRSGLSFLRPVCLHVFLLVLFLPLSAPALLAADDAESGAMPGELASAPARLPVSGEDAPSSWLQEDSDSMDSCLPGISCAQVPPLETEELVQPIYIPQALDLTESTDDLWARIRNGFAMPNLDDDLVARHQQYYLAHPEYLRRMVERSRLYLHHIVEELEKRNMPMELALLPMVESAYNPMAYSSSQASGLWQFIPSTGKYYNLQQNWWHDQRRDIIASTSAALDYLQYIYEMHGDWHLTLASYNWGEGAVGRAISKNEAKGLPASYSDLAMPGETRNYIPKLQALKNIFSTPQLVAELELPKVPNRPYFHTFVTQTPMDITLAARFADLGVEEFIALNPAHNRPVIQANSTLIIPADRMEQFMESLTTHDEPLSAWQTYILRQGENLEKIAPRFGISLANLKQVNGLHDRARASPGQTLLVPAQGGVEIGDLAFLPALAAPPPARSTRSYIVKKGDTLSAIARKHQTRVGNLKALNRLKSNTLKPGMRLALDAPAPRRTQAAPPRQNVAKNRVQEKPAARAKVTRHTVKKGDTLFSIARQYKVDLADLKRRNKLASNLLKVGMTLRIPSSG